MYRFGIGYDIHRFAKGKKLILGGVEIKHPKGLDGHSDADVLTHAICDALLGALGQGDIGEHFPNTDAAYKGISSMELLAKVNSLIASEGFKIANIDTVIQAQEPQLKAYKEKMRKAIAKSLRVEEDQINIKATTQEKLGALGKGEGMAAFASALLIKN